MTVLHLLGELRPSGAEVMLKLAAPHWRKAGCKLIALATESNVGEFAPQLEAAGFQVLHLPFGSGLFRWIWQYLAVIRKENVDVVHVHCEKNSDLTTTVPRITGCRVFRTVHNNFPYTGVLRARKIAARQFSRLCGCRPIAISPSVQTNERNRLHNPTTLCWNWFDDVRYLPPTDAERAAARAEIGLTDCDIALVSVGNGNDVKNYSAIIEALAMLRKRDVESREISDERKEAKKPSSLDSRPQSLLYLMVGNEHPDRIERKTAEQLADSVRFCGPQSDVRKYLWAADIFVMPSHYEGFSIAALEGLGTGIPCIFSECPGLSDFKAFPFAITWSGTDAASIAATIRAVMANGKWRTKSMESAAAVRAVFGTERRSGDYLRLWKESLSGKTSVCR